MKHAQTQTTQTDKTRMDDHIEIPDPFKLGQAVLHAYEQAQPVWEEYLEKYSTPEAAEELSAFNFDPLNVRETYLDFLDQLVQKPEKYLQLQAEFMQDWFSLWSRSFHKFMGDAQDNTPDTPAGPDLKSDRRFKAPEWQENALFDFIKNSYLLACQNIDKAITSAEGLNDKQKEKLKFQAKLFSDALSPTNFALTNPEVIKETVNTGGQNLVKGFENLINDLKRGHGDLSISTTQRDAFKLGENIATTEGSVVYENDLMQLIQYAPRTDQVFEVPLLVVPPWINKYYILDLRPENSFVRWLVEQGHTVFVVSWVNPGPEQAQKRFEDYMFQGIIDAAAQIQKITKETRLNAVGYCLGGTLLASTLAYLSKKKESKQNIISATFLTTLLDFEHAGDMKLFLDDEQLEYLDKLMDKHGVLEGKELQKTFSLMRANDLIWSFVVNNYLLGREPFPFDLLYWNSDCTNMPAAMHRFYLRSMYRDNKLVKKGGITFDDVPIDLSQIKIPAHFISTKEDHIAPWVATYEGARCLGGNVQFTLAESGHIAGIINPPEKEKYAYQTNSDLPKTPEAWLKNAKSHSGSWWPAWQTWIKPQAGKMVPARPITNAIEPAPGRYVRIQSC